MIKHFIYFVICERFERYFIQEKDFFERCFDNFIKLANLIIDNPDFVPPKPWGLTPNGDSWQVFQKHVKIRAGGFAQIQKIKAHTTLEDLANSIITEPDRVGNDAADALAKEWVGLILFQIIIA